MVVELDLQSGGDKVTKETLTKVFTDLGAAPEKFEPVLQKHASGVQEKILVTAGDQATCEKVAEKFITIGMKAEVRVLSEEDVPNEFEGSDVIPAGQVKLKELLDSADGQGMLVAFTAPWCKHCRDLVPELKSAATQLKGRGVRVVAINTQTSRALAASFDVRMLPTLKWLQPVGDQLAMAEYQGARDAASMVRFAQTAGMAIEEQMADRVKDASKAATAAADEKAARGSKIGMSKMGKSKAAGPAADGESKLAESKVKASEVKEGEESSAAPAAAVEKASTPAEAEAKAEEAAAKPAAAAA